MHDDFLTAHALKSGLEFLHLLIREGNGRCNDGIGDTVVFVVQTAVSAHTCAVLTQQILFQKDLEEIQQIRMKTAAKRLIQKGKAFCLMD